MAWDMWIECTMKKGSKMKSDGYLLQKILVHSRNVNNVAQIGATHNALASQTHNKWKHTDFGQNRLRQDEQYVQDLIACMHEFDSFPFNPTFPTLSTLQSGMPACCRLQFSSCCWRNKTGKLLERMSVQQDYISPCRCPTEQTLNIFQ